jgi:hypothetical protein
MTIRTFVAFSLVIGIVALAGCGTSVNPPRVAVAKKSRKPPTIPNCRIVVDESWADNQTSNVILHVVIEGEVTEETVRQVLTDLYEAYENHYPYVPTAFQLFAYESEADVFAGESTYLGRLDLASDSRGKPPRIEIVDENVRAAMKPTDLAP